METQAGGREPHQEIPSTFSQLVIMIATSALQQLGQLPDPSGQRPDVNLDGAQGMIDILETLNDKTKGNLDDGEKKILSESLTMLRLQYVEIKQATQRGDASAQAPATEDETAPEPEIEIPPPAPKSEDHDSKTRYRKSYG